jgi:hypothetical protein
MPLLSRLFGRKRQDDDKTPLTEWPLGAQPVGAQPPSDQSFGADPFVPYKPPADDAEIASPEERDEDAADQADAGAVPTEPESPRSETEPLAAGALPENETDHAVGLSDWETPDDAPTDRFEDQSVARDAGEGLLQVVGTENHHDVSSNGGIGGLETSSDGFSLPANELDHSEDPPFEEGMDRFGALSKESADAFTASLEPGGAFPLETADPFATPASTPVTPFNALAAAAADAFEMPIEEVADPFGISPSDLPESATEDSSASTGALFKSQTARANPFMKLVAEAHEVAEGSESPEGGPFPPASGGGKYLDLVQPAPTHDAIHLNSAAARLTTFAVPPAGAETHTLIGGKEDDLVPVIPDTEAGEAATAEIDESGIAEAAVASLKGACDFLVVRVKKLSGQDSTRVVAGLIALVGELDARYALDMGIRRRNGVEELLIDVRGKMAEGDRFILESLENGRGGLTADSFLRDLKTIAPGDRPRMLGHYVVFLTFMIKRVLHQYLRSLEEDHTRTYEISYHLDYLVEGVGDMLMKKVGAGAS